MMAFRAIMLRSGGIIKRQIFPALSYHSGGGDGYDDYEDDLDDLGGGSSRSRGGYGGQRGGGYNNQRGGDYSSGGYTVQRSGGGGYNNQRGGDYSSSGYTVQRSVGGGGYNSDGYNAGGYQRQRVSGYDGRQGRFGGGGGGYGGGGYSRGGRFDGGGYGGAGAFRGGKSDFAGANLRPVNWDSANLQPIAKNFYQEHAAVTNRDQSSIDMWLTENEVTLDGQNIPRPVFEFAESTFPDPIQELLHSKFTRPITIQSISWPCALSGRDLISVAKTGSGKTLGFILPAIVHTINQTPRSHGEGPSVLVMLPTRELAQQVEEVAKDYCRLMGLNVICCYGGASKLGQANELRRGIDICIATPGRMLDFLENGTTNMRRCSFLVLDEADRMLDMGFEPQIRKIVSQIRPDRQTLMFSATWPKEVRQLAADFHQDPVLLTVGSSESANPNIEQRIQVVSEDGKPKALQELLQNEIGKQKTMIFVATRRQADGICNAVRRFSEKLGGVWADSIHSDKSQDQRNSILNSFRQGNTQILIGTDVMARGLDIDDVKYVVNYDYPNDHVDYIHRIGRTGRCDKKGIAVTFFTPDHAHKANDLINVIRAAGQEPPEELVELVGGGRKRSAGGGFDW